MIAPYYGWLIAFCNGVPMAEVHVIHPKTGQKTRYAGIVDTGADHLQLDTAAAAYAGLNYAMLPGIAVKTAGSSNVVLKQGSVDIELQGVRLTVPALFGPSPAGVLLGRSALLKALEVAFDATDWGCNVLVGSGTLAAAGPSTGAQQASPAPAADTQAGQLTDEEIARRAIAEVALQAAAERKIDIERAVRAIMSNTPRDEAIQNATSRGPYPLIIDKGDHFLVDGEVVTKMALIKLKNRR